MTRLSDPRISVLARSRRHLPEDVVSTEVSMFGRQALVANDRLMLTVAKDGSLLVRVDLQRREELLARDGAQPADMGSGRKMGPHWIEVDSATLVGAGDLDFWIDLAKQFNHVESTQSTGKQQRKPKKN